VYTLPDTRDIVALALAEDFGVPPARFGGTEPADPRILERDATSASVLPQRASIAGRIVAREDLVVAGLPVVDEVYSMLADAVGASGDVEVFPLVAEGSSVRAGAALADVEGPAAVVLGGERTALNFMMTLCGIASEAKRWQTAAGERLEVVDTRKTYPGLRALSKYATAVGGGTNHRLGLWDMVLVKDNHLRRTTVDDAVAHARTSAPGLRVEVEADTVEQAVAAVRAGADLVLLDNMDDDVLQDAVGAVRVAADECGRVVLTEASGGVTIDRVYAMRRLGLDRVSTSAITFAPPKDVALDVEWSS